MAETQTVLKNKTLTLALSNPSSKTTQSQLEDIVKNLRLAHINDVNTLNEQIKRRDEIIDEQNDIIEDLLDEREAIINEEPVLIQQHQTNRFEERFQRIKNRMYNEGFKGRRERTQ